MAYSSVPEFGNWENQDNVPYTVYFDKARKNRGGKMINPNDPTTENHDTLTTANSSRPPPPSNIRKSPARSENVGQKMANDSNHAGRGGRSGGPPRMANDSNHVGRGARSGGPPRRRSEGLENSIERSPLHPHQAKYTGRGSQGSRSPAWDGKNSYDSSHGTPGRARPKPVSQGDESPDGSAIPVFGEWDESDPQSGEKFTHIFNKAREEKNNGTGNISSTPKHPSYGVQNQPAKSRKTRCFPWC